jgi:hypothetical protein
MQHSAIQYRLLPMAQLRFQLVIQLKDQLVLLDQFDIIQTQV